MPWVRNLRRFVSTGAGLGSEDLMELETKRILLEIFKERQRKSAEAGSIPSFYKKKPEEGSISSRVQRLAKYRFLKKQSELLLNADDLDAMWVCLRENCVIDDATGAEKMNYEDFCHIATVCTEQIGQKCKRFFSPSNFMKFEKDDSGRIAILPFYLYVMLTVSCFLQEKLLNWQLMLLIMRDEGVHWAVQNGLHLSRSTVVYFKHNDMASLASTLEKLTRGNKRAKKIRRYIVVESIYQNSSQIAPLDEIVRLKDNYRFRVILEESHSFGVLGKSGRGLAEHYGVPGALLPSSQTRPNCLVKCLGQSGQQEWSHGTSAGGVRQRQPMYPLDNLVLT
ncbi:putative serine/threonine-protein phosphatase 2A regulatory subunit B'' subunit TON2 [Zea mays]|uniref:Putative serine/threonine-protein phosphatase 2A regulatory subunit B'' subunit TON2 n=1 Tax=Zea mays TaxID=4577 RepID=A0A3L6F1W2_MAIZE|nr:putative serine/threonine-protein phosphatase 2A regulatory subunit B'' subunit TON2 [Zea mays]